MKHFQPKTGFGKISFLTGLPFFYRKDVRMGTEHTEARPDLGPILDAVEAGELLHMHPQSVRKLAKEGVIPGYRIPGSRKYKFFTNELMATLRGNPLTETDSAETDSAETDSAETDSAETDKGDLDEVDLGSWGL